MALKSLTFVMFFALLVASSSLFGVSTAFNGQKALAFGFEAMALPPNVGFPNDFVFLNTKDPKVIDLANYAVDEYNKENNCKLVFRSVFDATYTNTEKGVNLCLWLFIEEPTNERIYFFWHRREMNVYEVKILVGKDDKKVTAFKKID